MKTQLLTLLAGCGVLVGLTLSATPATAAPARPDSPARAATAAVPAKAATAPAKRTVTDHYDYAHKDVYHQAVVTYTPGARSQPWLIVIHGGSWIHSDPSSIAGSAATLAAQGYTIFNISYPLVNPHGEQSALPVATWADQKAAFFTLLAWIHRYYADWGLNPDRGGVFGYSSGGQSALVLGLTGDGSTGIRAVVTASGAVTPQRVAEIVTGANTTDTRYPNFDTVYKDEQLLTGCPFTDQSPDCVAGWRDIEPEYLGSRHDPAVLMWSGRNDTAVPYLSGGQVANHLRTYGHANAIARYVPNLGHSRATALGSYSLKGTLSWLNYYVREGKTTPLVAR